MSTDLDRILRNARRRTLAAIKRLVTPHFRESGYRTRIDPKKGIIGNSRPMLLWTNGERDIPVDGGFYVDSIIAITEHGPMTDAHGGGCVTDGWGNFPLEDLVRLRKWLEANLPSLEKTDAQPA